MTQLIYANESQYFAAAPYRIVEYVSAILNIVGIATIFFAFAYVARRTGLKKFRDACKIGFILALIPIVDFVRRDLSIGYGTLLRFGVVPFAVAATFFVGLGFYARAYIVRILYRIVLVLSPGALLLGGELVLKASSPVKDASSAAIASSPATTPQHAKGGNRVVWIIFDEWDQLTVLEHRPLGLKLPILDSFKSAAFVATDAYPPGGNTLESIPALLAGKVFHDVRPAGYHNLEVRESAHGRLINFETLPNIFTELEAKGDRIAVAGWYHPYDALVTQGSSASVCWRPIPLYQGFRGTTVLGSMGKQLIFVFAPFLVQKTAVSAFDAIHSFGCAAVADPMVDFAYLHYSVPHLPGVYDPRSGKVTLRIANQAESYADNLQLCDRVLGDLLQRIAAAKLDRRTTIILTSDHWWRDAPDRPKASDKRVPLIIRTPNGGQEELFGATIHTVILKQFIEDVLAGKIANNASIARWFAAHRN